MDRFPLGGRKIRKDIGADQGGGIPREHLAKIFEPYFTTKKKGSGLGLAMAHSIVKNHDGYITAESERGKGSVFTVFLPASAADPTETDGKAKEMTIRKCWARVLLMDDEEMIREITGEMLGSIGYNVSFAADGEEAMSLFIKARSENRPFDVVLLDLTIPGSMGGAEVLKTASRGRARGKSRGT